MYSRQQINNNQIKKIVSKSVATQHVNVYVQSTVLRLRCKKRECPVGDLLHIMLLE